jgi:hypothetical protein
MHTMHACQWNVIFSGADIRTGLRLCTVVVQPWTWKMNDPWSTGAQRSTGAHTVVLSQAVKRDKRAMWMTSTPSVLKYKMF